MLPARPVRLLSLLTLTVLGLTQCESESTAPLAAPCLVNVGLQIGPGTTPRIGWTPNCALLSVDVVDSLTGETVWSLVSSSGRNTVPPGVRYGSIPRGTREQLAPVPLIAGRRYWVFLSRLDERDPDLPVVLTAADGRFTPVASLLSEE